MEVNMNVSHSSTSCSLQNFRPTLFIPTHISLLQVMQCFNRSKWDPHSLFHLIAIRWPSLRYNLFFTTCLSHSRSCISSRQLKSSLRNFGPPGWIRNPTRRQLHADPHWYSTVAHPFELSSRYPVARSLASFGTTPSSSWSTAKPRPQLSVTTPNTTFSNCIDLSLLPTQGQARDAWQWDHFSPLTKRSSAAACVSCFPVWWVFHVVFSGVKPESWVYHHSECFVDM